jgi:hypothetical protein
MVHRDGPVYETVERGPRLLWAARDALQTIAVVTDVNHRNLRQTNLESP